MKGRKDSLPQGYCRKSSSLLFCQKYVEKMKAEVKSREQKRFILSIKVKEVEEFMRKEFSGDNTRLSSHQWQSLILITQDLNNQTLKNKILNYDV